MAHLLQQAGLNQDATDNQTQSFLFHVEKPETMAGYATSWSESDTATCASTSSWPALPTSGLMRRSSSPGQAREKSSCANHALDYASTRGSSRSPVYDPSCEWSVRAQSGTPRKSIVNREPVVLERRAAETQEDGVVKKKTSAELAALEAYLAKQREHLAAAICKEWATPNSSSERQARLKAACQELVKRSFHEVFCAREAEGSKATIGCMRRSTGGSADL